jgi:hypothetical protein
MKSVPSKCHRRTAALRRPHARGAVAAALLAMSAMPSSAATVDFVGLAPNPAERSFWDIAANWAPAVLPGSADDARLGAFLVHHRTGNTLVNSFESGAGGLLRLTDSSLGYASASSAVHFEQWNAQLSGAALFRVTGSAVLLSGTHRGTGVTELAGAGGTHQVGSMTFTEGRALRNLGALTQNADSVLDIVVTETSTSRFVNDGSFNITSGAQRSLNPVNGVVVADMVTNNGSITKTGAGTYGFDSLDQRGTLAIAAGRINLNRRGSFASGSVTGGAGVLSLWGTNSVLDVASGADTSSLNLRIEASGATLNHAGDLALQSLAQTNGIVDGAGRFTPLSSASLGFGVHRGSGVTELGVGAGPYTIGSMSFQSGRTLRNVGVLTQNADSVLDIVVTEASTSRFVNDGSFNITSGAQRSLNPVNGVVVADMVINNGSITKTGAGTYGFDSLDQRGTLDIAAGRINLNRRGSFASGSVTGGAGVLSLWGTNSVLDVASGADTATLNLRIEASGATLNHAGDLALQSLAQTNGIVDGAGRFTPLSSANLGFGVHRGPGVTELGVGAGPYTIGSMSFQFGRTLRNVGALTQNADSVMEVWVATGSTSRFVNDGHFNITSGALQSRNTGTGVVVADMVINNGSITKTGPGIYRFDSLEQRGGLTVQAGNLIVNGPARLVAGETIIAPSATLTLRDNGARLEGGILQMQGTLATDVINARLLQTGGVLQGDGTLRDAAYFGPSDFTLVSSGGRLTAGSQDSVGQLTIDAGISLSGAAVLEVDILSLASFDTLSVGRLSLLGGSVQVDALDPNLSLAVGNRFRVATFALDNLYSGTFAGVSAPSPFNGFFAEFQVDYNADSVDLVVVSLTPVPEPATWALMAIGVAGLLGWRRRCETRPARVASMQEPGLGLR